MVQFGGPPRRTQLILALTVRNQLLKLPIVPLGIRGMEDGTADPLLYGPLKAALSIFLPDVLPAALMLRLVRDHRAHATIPAASTATSQISAPMKAATCSTLALRALRRR